MTDSGEINHNTLLELVIDLYEAGDYAQGITHCPENG